MHVACFPMKRFTFGNDPHLVIGGPPETRNMQIIIEDISHTTYTSREIWHHS